MPLFLITGLPGTGKSTVCAELRARDYQAYDGDIDRLAHWFDASGKPVAPKDEQRTPEFVQSHTRDIARQTIEELAAGATDKMVFVCNDPENEDELHDLFSGVFALVVDETTRQHRLATRKNNGWGKLPHERAYDLAIKETVFARYKKYGYTIIDADQPVRRVVEMILRSLTGR